MWILFNLILFVLFIIYIVKRFYSYLVGRAIQSVDWLIELLLIFSRCLMWTKFSHLRSMASAVADSNSWNSFSTNIRTRDKLTSTAEASLNVVRWPCSDSRRITALEGVHLSGQQTTRRQNFELGLGLGQWRSYYGANGASAPPGPPRVTYTIRANPLSFFARGRGAGH